MTTAEATSVPYGERWSAAAVPMTLGALLLAVAGAASIGAGAIHAAAIGAHAEHRQAVITFTLLGAFQVVWGTVAFWRPGRLVAAIGFVGGLAAVAGWVLAKSSGISFVAGLDVPEPIQLADAAAALLAAAVTVGAAGALAPSGAIRRTASAAISRLVPLAAAVSVTALAIPSMVSAGNHRHAEGEAGHVHTTAEASSGTATVLPTKPYDPTKPIDLSGVPGVTPEEQARAENLIAVTLLRLPHFADPATASAAGYKSIQDGVTGFEHYINWSYIDDDKILDPDYPESLVYKVYRDGHRELQAAMFMLTSKDTLDTVPDIGGSLTQWHIHHNLCFTNEPGDWKVRGVTKPDGTCTPPLVASPIQAPMIHVWIVKQACGPFAALEGVGGGQIKPGQVRLSDHQHGSA
jgi:hypothetical protein